MSEYVIMPKADYTAACNAIRTKTGKADLIKSGDMEGEILGITSGGGSSADVRYVTFMNEDGTVELGKKAVATGDDCADPIARGVFSTPTKESTAQYTYTFYGWATTPNGAADSNWNKAVTEDRTVYSNFASVVRYYTITYYDSDGTTVLKTQSLAYGTTPSYTPVSDNYMFDKWVPDAIPVTENTSYIAMWKAKPAFQSSTWADIKQIADSGNADTVFAVGDTRTETLTYADGTTEQITWVLASINGDFPSNNYFPGSFVDGEKAHLVIVAAHALSTLMYMGPLGNSFEKSDLRAFLNGDFLNALPTDLQLSVKEVFTDSNKKGNTSKILIPNSGEMGGSSFYSGSFWHFALFDSDKSRIRKQGPNGSAVKYWLRDSAASGAYQLYSTVRTTGVIDGRTTYAGTNGTYGVVPMFFL